jgi:transposase-like protein
MLSGTIKECPHCNGIMFWFNPTIIEKSHWRCAECNAVEITEEDNGEE